MQPQGKVGQRLEKPRLTTFFLCVLLVIFLIFSPAYLLPLLQMDILQDELDSRRESSFHGVITLWQIDAFEGGTGSRTAWLNKRAAEFERKYNGVFIVVRSITPEKAAVLLRDTDAAVYPDMISFGAGVKGISADIFQKPDPALLLPLRPDAAASGGGYCVPWCMGAYALLVDSQEYQKAMAAGKTVAQLLGSMGKVINTKKGERTVYSLGIPANSGYFPGGALAAGLGEKAGGMLQSQYALRSGEKDTAQVLFEAYNYSYLLGGMVGTQRDVYRLISAETANKARATEVLPLAGYTDLVQYMGMVRTKNDQKTKVMEAFIATLLQGEKQAMLTEIGLFPVSLSAQAAYGDARMQALYGAIKDKTCVIPSPFDFEERITENTLLLQNFLQKGEEWEKIKKIFVDG